MAELEQKQAKGSLSYRDRSRLSELAGEHSSALYALVERNQLDEEVSKQIDAAFRLSVCRADDTLLICSDEIIMCYFVMRPPFWKESIEYLSKQAEILAKEAWLWPLGPEIVARAQANVERDIGELSYSSEVEEAAAFLTSVLLEEW